MTRLSHFSFSFYFFVFNHLHNFASRVTINFAMIQLNGLQLQLFDSGRSLQMRASAPAIQVQMSRLQMEHASSAWVSRRLEFVLDLFVGSHLLPPAPLSNHTATSVWPSSLATGPSLVTPLLYVSVSLSRPPTPQIRFVLIPIGVTLNYTQIVSYPATIRCF